MIRSIAGTLSDGNGYADIAADATLKFYYYDAREFKDIVFYVYNNDTGSDTVYYEIHAFQKPTNWSTTVPDTALPTDVLVTQIQAQTSVNKGAFSAKHGITNTDSYTTIAVGLEQNSGAVDSVRIFGWGRHRH